MQGCTGKGYGLWQEIWQSRLYEVIPAGEVAAEGVGLTKKYSKAVYELCGGWGRAIMGNGEKAVARVVAGKAVELDPFSRREDRCVCIGGAEHATAQ